MANLIIATLLLLLSISFGHDHHHPSDEANISLDVLARLNLIEENILGRKVPLRVINTEYNHPTYFYAEENYSDELSLDEKRILAEKFAPIVYLHPKDMNRPDSVDEYLKTVTLRDADGNILLESPTPDELVDDRYNLPDNFLHFKSARPTGSNEYYTGKPVEASSSDSTTGSCTAPVYVDVRSAGNDVLRFTYAMFYPFNGPQTLRASYTKDLLSAIFRDPKKRNFPLSPFARHEGDFESVTVFVKQSTEAMLGVSISQHGHAEFSYNPQKINGRPVIYSALNSHANYFKEETRVLDDIIEDWGFLLSILGLGINWAKAVDTTTLDETVTYNQPNPYFRKVQWDTKNHIIMAEENIDVQNSLKFLGSYGDKNMDNSSIEYPPSGLPDDMASDVYTLTKLAMDRGFLPDNFLKGGGPRGPYKKDWWVGKQALPGDLITWSDSKLGVILNDIQEVYSFGGIELQYYTPFEFEILAGFGGRVRDKKFTRLLLAFFNVRTGERRYQVVGSGTANREDYEEYVYVDNGYAIVGISAAVDNNNLASITLYYQKIDPANTNGNYLTGNILKHTVGNGKEEVKYVPNDPKKTIPLIGIGISSAKSKVDGMKLWGAPFYRLP